jgi:CheY-like chemotaxis protein
LAKWPRPDRLGQATSRSGQSETGERRADCLGEYASGNRLPQEGLAAACEGFFSARGARYRYGWKLIAAASQLLDEIETGPDLQSDVGDDDVGLERGVGGERLVDCSGREHLGAEMFEQLGDDEAGLEVVFDKQDSDATKVAGVAPARLIWGVVVEHDPPNPGYWLVLAGHTTPVPSRSPHASRRVHDRLRSTRGTWPPELRLEGTAIAQATFAPRPQVLRDIRILIVEDDPDQAAMYEFIFDSVGAEARSVESVAEARIALERERFDVILSDIMMLDETGYDLVRWLRTVQGENRELAAIALTGRVTEEDRDEALAAGFDEHCRKPCQPGELLETIERLLKLRRP